MHRALPVACLIVLCEALAFSAVLPVLDTHTLRLGGDARHFGLLMALVSFPKVIFNPLFGMLSDRFGRRPMLAVATLGTLAGSLGWALSGSLTWLLAARLVTGIFGAQAGLAQAIAADVSPPERRAAAVGLLGAAFGVALAFGPVLGGLVSHYGDTFAVGWASASLQALSLVAITLLPETRPPRDRAAHLPSASATARILRTSGVPLLLAASLVVTIATSQVVSTFSPLMTDLYGFADAAKGVGWAVFGVIGIGVQGGLLRLLVARFGERATAGAGATLLIAGFVLLASRPALAGFWIATVLMAVGVALVLPALTAMLSRRVGPDVQGALAGLNQSALGLGRGTGNYAGGELYRLGGVLPAYAVAAALTACGALLLIGVRRSGPPSRPPPHPGPQS